MLHLKVRRRDFAGCIVGHSHQRETRTPIFQPVMTASVHLQHHALLRTPFPPRPVLGSAAFLRRYDACGAQNTTHALPADAEPFGAGELVVKMRIVEAGVFTAR